MINTAIKFPLPLLQRKSATCLALDPSPSPPKEKKNSATCPVLDPSPSSPKKKKKNNKIFGVHSSCSFPAKEFSGISGV